MMTKTTTIMTMIIMMTIVAGRSYHENKKQAIAIPVGKPFHQSPCDR